MNNDDILKKIDRKELGRELQQARNRRGMTQADAAEVIKAARTTLIAIEKGTRKIRADELIKLASAYGRKVSDFARPRPAIEPFQAQFRGPLKINNTDKNSINDTIHSLEEQSRNYLELEKITNKPLEYKYPEPLEIKGLDIDRAAEGIASQERNRLGLGDGPISILRDILEQDVGFRIFYLPMKPSKFSAVYMYDHKAGGCIAINSYHPEERRRISLAHDYAHFLTKRYIQKFHIEDIYQRLPEYEQFADYFALYFLMPTGSLTRRFNAMKSRSGKFSTADLCILAHYFGVSLEAMARRLEQMRLIPAGTWEKLLDRGLKVRDAQKQLNLEPIPAKDQKFPMRYQYLALEAYGQGLLSEGQLSRFLDTDRLETRRIVKSLDNFADNAEDISNAIP